MSALKPSIITPEAFEQVTNIRGHDRKNLIPIDKALKNYHIYKNQNIVVAADLLIEVLKACQRWLVAKAVKIANGSANTLARKTQVDFLVEQAAHLLAWYRYELNKTSANGGYRAANANTRALQPGYNAERTQFVQAKANNYTPTGAINPIGGSFAHEVKDWDQNLQGVNFGNLTDNDFQTLYNNFADLGMQKPLVHFVRKAERLRENYVVVVNGLLLFKGQLLTTQGYDWMYVMDEYGNLLTQAHNADLNRNQPNARLHQQYNHSSLNAGKDVICAGTWNVQQGRLRMISNESGHYQPTQANLHDCVTVLVDEDAVDIGAARVEINRAGNRFRIDPLVTFYTNPNTAGVAMP